MGMFDEFDCEILCPSCSQDIGPIQSKDLFRELRQYKLGDLVQNEFSVAKDGGYRGYTICFDCQIELGITLTINKHSWVGYLVESVTKLNKEGI
jgi:hypothetical protein